LNPRMPNIVTLTPNPAIDLSTAIDRVVPTVKLRCTAQRRDPGGGGVNVARVIKRFGGDVEAIFPAGGFTGQLLCRLIDNEGIASRVVEAQAETRQDFYVSELATGLQYRFVLPGQQLREREWQECLSVLASSAPAPKFVVGSGSLPPGVPDDFYARAASVARRLGAKFLLDTSGAPLKAAIEQGLYLIKPNLREMSELVGGELATEDEWLARAHALIERGKAEILALSLGHIGALVVTRDEAFRAHALPIKPVSAVGAGDSFLGALVASLANGTSLAEAFRRGVAAGAAALLNAGTELCHPADVNRLAAQVQIEPVD
jgi:6-phosphofructokinase 2